MKKLIIFLLLIFYTCNNPGGSNIEENGKEYSIIFNWAGYILNENCALAVINPNGTDIKKIGTSIDVPQNFTISDDGSTVVYVSTNLKVASIDNLTTRTIANPGYSRFPKISPNGKYIVYEQYDYNVGLNVINVDGTNNKIILPNNIPFYFNWTPDGRGIYYSNENDSSGYDYFYIDKDGLDDPVRIENPFVGNEINYARNEFEPINLPFEDHRDNVSFNDDQVNNEKNKAWEFINITIIDSASSRPKVDNYLLGYDFKNMTVKLLINSTQDLISHSLAWSPHSNELILFTLTGIDILKFDGTRIRIFEISNPNAQYASVYYKWIPRKD